MAAQVSTNNPIFQTEVAQVAPASAAAVNDNASVLLCKEGVELGVGNTALQGHCFGKVQQLAEKAEHVEEASEKGGAVPANVLSESPDPKKEPEASDQSKTAGLRPFVIMSVSYLLYTVTDGAIRMIVLLQAYNLGFTAMCVCLSSLLGTNQWQARPLIVKPAWAGVRWVDSAHASLTSSSTRL
jgi:hypothetical protein